jgi:hypothetical protein
MKPVGGSETIAISSMALAEAPDPETRTKRTSPGCQFGPNGIGNGSK